MVFEWKLWTFLGHLVVQISGGKNCTASTSLAHSTLFYENLSRISMVRILIKKQQKKPTTLQVFFFWKMGPLGIAGKSNITKTQFWSSFFAQIFSFGMLDLFRQGEDDFWFNPTAGVRDPQGWYLSEGLDGAISEWQCFRQDATLMICDRFFCFRNDHLTCILVAELDVWNKNGRDLCMYVPPWTFLQLQNQCQWNWIIYQAISFRGNVGKGWTTSNTRRVYE